MFLRNVGKLLSDYMVLHPWSQRSENHKSKLPVFELELHITADGQPASLSWNKAPIWGLRPDLDYLSCSCGAPSLTRGRVCLFMCCWPLPAQSFSGPSPLGLATIFYCLRFETPLFVASYDSQGHGGGIRSRLHTCICLWMNKFAPRQYLRPISARCMTVVFARC
jgi:hypothetical protein